MPRSRLNLWARGCVLPRRRYRPQLRDGGGWIRREVGAALGRSPLLMTRNQRVVIWSAALFLVLFVLFVRLAQVG